MDKENLKRSLFTLKMYKKLSRLAKCLGSFISDNDFAGFDVILFMQLKVSQPPQLYMP